MTSSDADRNCARPTWRALVVLAVLTAWATPAPAVTFSGHATTVARLFDVRHDPRQLPDVDSVRTYRPVDQLLRLTWTDIGRQGSRPGPWRVEAFVRGRTDLATGQRGGQSDFEVLLAHATFRPRSGLLELQLGRQQAITGFGWHAFDGLRLDFARLRRAHFFVMGGVPLEFATDGAPQGGDWTWGAGAKLLWPGHGSLGVDWEVRDFSGGSREETAGLDLGLTFGRTSLAANADYSVPLERFGETTLALSRTVAGRHVIEGRFTRVEPIFATDTIWAVFTTNPYDERRLSWERRGSPSRWGAYFSDEQYEKTEHPGPQGLQHAGVTFVHESRRGATQRADLGWQDGFSGRRLAGRWDGDWRLLRRLHLGGGASLNRYRNAYRLTEDDETLAARVRIRHDHDGRWSLGLEAEQFLGRRRDTLRATLVFTTRFGKVAGARDWWSGRIGDAFAQGPASGPRERRADAPDEPDEPDTDDETPGGAE